jgi:hypothetical protein
MSITGYRGEHRASAIWVGGWPSKCLFGRGGRQVGRSINRLFNDAVRWSALSFEVVSVSAQVCRALPSCGSANGFGAPSEVVSQIIATIYELANVAGNFE